MRGHGPYSKILNWMQSEHAASEFVASVPPSLATPTEPRLQNLHRLTYRASGTPVPPSSSPRILKFEIPLETRDPEPDAGVTNSDTKHVLQASGTPRMWTGYQSEANVLMPHRLDDASIRLHFVTDVPYRSTDVRLSIQDFSLAPDTALPLVLQQYVTEFDS